MILGRVLGTVVFLLIISGSFLAYRFKLLDRWGPKKRLYIVVVASGLLCVLVLSEYLSDPGSIEPIWLALMAGVVFYGIRKAWREWRESASVSTDV